MISRVCCGLLVLFALGAGVAVADHGGNASDAGRPYIEFDDPFNTTGNAAIPDHVEADSGQAFIAGGIVSEASADRVTITLTTEHPDVTRQQRRRNKNVPKYTKQYQLNDPGDSFRQRVRLGTGATQLNLSVIDVHGNYNLYRTTVHVNDTTPPTITTTQDYTKDGSRYLRYRARDDTNLRRLRVKYKGRWYVAFADDNPFVRSGRVASKGAIGEAPFTVLVEAVDVAGNSNQRAFEYRAPGETTTPTETPTPTISPTPTPSPTPAGGRVTAAGETETATETVNKRPNDTLETPTPGQTVVPPPTPNWEPESPGNLVVVIGALLVGGVLLGVAVKL